MAAGTSAGVTGGAAAVSAAATTFQKGDKGDNSDPGLPLKFKSEAPWFKTELYGYCPKLASLYHYQQNIHLQYQQRYEIKNNFSNIIVSGKSTLLSSVNVSGPTSLNNVS